MAYRPLRKDAVLRVLIDGVGFCTTADLLRHGSCDSFIAQAFVDFENQRRFRASEGQPMITGRMAQYPDFHDNLRNVQIDFIR